MSEQRWTDEQALAVLNGALIPLSPVAVGRALLTLEAERDEARAALAAWDDGFTGAIARAEKAEGELDALQKKYAHEYSQHDYWEHETREAEIERDALKLRVAALFPVARAAYHFTRANGIDGELLADLCAQLVGFKSEDFDHE